MSSITDLTRQKLQELPALGLALLYLAFLTLEDLQL